MSNRFDNFNRADGAYGTPSDGGSAYETVGTNWLVTNNTARLSSTAPSGAVLETGFSDADVTLVISTLMVDFGRLHIGLRWTDSNNFWYTECRRNGTGVQFSIYRRQAGVTTNVTGIVTVANTAFAVGDAFRFRGQGNRLTVYHTPVATGIEVLRADTGSGQTFNQTATKHGLASGGSADSTVRIDNLSITDASPTPLVAGTLSESSHEITTATLAWTNAVGGTGTVTAQLQRSSAGANAWSNVSGATSSPATVTGLSQATAYDFRVAYTDAASDTVYSNTATITTDLPPAPSAPSNLTALAVSATRIDLSWTDNSNNEVTFRIERSPNGSSGWTEITSVSTDVATYSDTGLTGGTTYYYRVRARNAGGDSAYTSIASAMTLAPGTPAVPVAVVATPMTAYDVAVTWERLDDQDTSVKVRRQTGGSGSFDVIATLPAHENVYADDGCKPSTSYSYTVEALNGAMTAGPSTAASCTTPATTATIPTISPSSVAVVTTPFTASITVTDTTPASVSAATNTSPIVVTAAAHGCKVGSTVYVRITGVTGNTAANVSNAPAVVIDADTLSLTGTIGNGNYISGGIVNMTGKVSIERAEVGNGPYQFRALVGQTVSPKVKNGTITYNDWPLKPGTTYAYRFRFQNDAGNRSDFSDPVTVTTQARPTNVPVEASDLTAAGTGTIAVTLNWTDNSDGTASYKIERTAPPPYNGAPNFADGWEPTWTVVGTTAVGATSYVDTTVTAGQAYLYRIKASGSGGDSAPTAEVPARTPRTAATANVYNIGPGQTYTSIGAFNWDGLNPGDTVRIHCNKDGSNNVVPYFERFLISRRGTPAARIVVEGVPDPATGDLPIIDGDGATTHSQFTVSYTPYERNSLLFIGSHSTGDPCGPGYLTVRHLHFRNTKAPMTFTGYQGGAAQSWAAFSAAVYVQKGDDVLLEGLRVTNCAQAVFYSDKGDYNIYCERITIRGAHTSEMGNEGSQFEHAFYIEGTDCVVEECLMEPTVGGGNQIKDRGAGTVFRYNWIASPGVHMIDLPEAEASLAVVRRRPEYNRQVIYGNVFEMYGGVSGIIHPPGDHGSINNRRGVLYFYNNTLVHRSNDVDTLFDVRDPPGHPNVLPGLAWDARNNIIAVYPTAGGTAPPIFYLTQNYNVGYVGRNWASNSVQAKSAGGTGYVGGMPNIVNNGTTNAPGFVDLSGGNLGLVEDADARGLAGVLAGAVAAFPVARQYAYPASSVMRSSTDDLGAFEYAEDTPTDPDSSSSESDELSLSSNSWSSSSDEYSSSSSSSSSNDDDEPFLDANPVHNDYPAVYLAGNSPGVVSQIDQLTFKFNVIHSLEAPVTVVLLSPYANSVVRYTLNGKNPNDKSHLYRGPLVFSQNASGSDNTVIKARVYDKTNANNKSKIIRLEFRVR